MLETMNEDFVTTAQAKGASHARIYFKHALANAAIPIITVSALQFGAVLTGTIIVETIFDWPGLGTLLYQAIQSRDYPSIQASVLVIALTYAAVNLIAADTSLRQSESESSHHVKKSATAHSLSRSSLAAIAAPWLGTTDPNAFDLKRKIRITESVHALVRTRSKRLRRLLASSSRRTHISLMISFSVVAASVLIGLLIASSATYKGGVADILHCANPRHDPSLPRISSRTRARRGSRTQRKKSHHRDDRHGLGRVRATRQRRSSSFERTRIHQRRASERRIRNANSHANTFGRISHRSSRCKRRLVSPELCSPNQV